MGNTPRSRTIMSPEEANSVLGSELDLARGYYGESVPSSSFFF